MKLTKKSVFVCLALVIGASFLIFNNAKADDSSALTTEQIEKIKNSCLVTKNTLNQLHASDALLRVNRGQLYEALATKLMDGFNGRVSNNNLNNSGLVSVTNSYETALNAFRNDYIEYEEQLSAAIDIDCSKQPVEFYDSVASARTKRNKVHDDIVNLHNYIDKYSEAVKQFEENYKTIAGGEN